MGQRRGSVGATAGMPQLNSARAPLPTRSYLRAATRCARVLLHVLVGLLLALLVTLPGGRRLPRERLTGWWNAQLLAILHVRVRRRGRPAAEARMLVANHVSWLDISVIVADVETRFVSKAEVRDWPLAGQLATAAGTFYLRRGAGGTRHLIHALTEHLQRGRVTVFPEGTTTDGHTVLRFQPRLFAAAIAAGCAVQPVALRYGRAAGGEDIAPFVGEQTLTDHLWRLLQERELEVELIYCPPIQPRPGQDRASLAAAAQAAVSAALAPQNETPAATQRERHAALAA